MNKTAFDKKIESTLDDRAAGQEFSEALFDWLIRTMNGALPPETPMSQIQDVAKNIHYRLKIHCEFEVI